MSHVDQPKAADIIFSDYPVEKRLEWVQGMANHSSLSFAGELTHAGYKNIPVSYLVCEGDLCIPVNVQREGIDMMENESGRKVDVTSIKAGHGPNITARQEVVDWLLATAGTA